MRYEAIQEYFDAPSNPIQITNGEELIFIKETDQNSDWPNWVFCRGSNKEGWIPKKILKISGEKVISTEDYLANEHNFGKGEIFISEKKLNGWIWAVKESSPDNWGWAPLTHLQKMQTTPNSE